MAGYGEFSTMGLKVIHPSMTPSCISCPMSVDLVRMNET